MSEYHKIETLFNRDEKTFKVKVDELRKPVYATIKEWDFTEKVDGTNIRIIWRPAYAAIGENEKALTYAGKTDNAQLHAELVNWLRENVTVEKLLAALPDAHAVIYGEGYGAGIQKGGGYSATKKFIVFDVLIQDKWWLDWDNVKDVAAKLGLETVPYFGRLTLDDAIQVTRQGFKSRLGDGTADAEGLVGRPIETLFDKKGARIIVKLKTKDF